MATTARAEIALLGTSADPPTVGHQALLEALLTRFDRVATWASDNPMKRHDADLEQRCDLLKTLVESIASRRLQLAQELSSPFAVTTLERASERWPDHRLCFVVGSDLAQQIPAWKESQRMLQQCNLGIVPREGWPLEPCTLETLRQMGASTRVLPLGIPATASSQVKQKQKRQQVPECLWPLLLKHNLYGFNAANP
ncbi:nicotinate-nucleotide adenylyltransferase [Synechococcus sp. UW179A]|uniref:nicotinate-nucleotide adenylyltransferase n=1 Tax=Synechococcus sp. UW179A TaxID=2575510 RepID=UPI000E0EBDE3|nr:nicotinate-nucleotide adenylyltransferase [Synechococcus sp. UW179A]